MSVESHPWTTGLTLFGQAWSARNSRQRGPAWAAGLANFAVAWRVARPIGSATPAQIPAPLSASRLARALTTLNVAVRAIIHRGDVFDPWAAAQLRRDERRNASVLAAFLTPRQVGDLAPRFLHSLLRRLDDPHGLLPTLAALRHGYRVRAEDCPLGLTSERVDLTLEGHGFLLGIEVKIDAPEGFDQFTRYVRTITRRARDGNRSPHVVILARQRMTVPGAMAANWSDVAAAARDVAATDPANSISRLLRRFAAHVGSF